MAIAHVASAKVAGASGGTTASIDTTGASLLTLVCGYGAVAISVSDSKGNTWTALTEHSSGATKSIVYYCANPTVGTGHTFTLTGASSASSMIASAWSGVATSSPLDQDVGYDGVSGTIAVLASGTVTPSVDGCLVVAGFSLSASVTSEAAGSGWTSAEFQNYVGGTNYGVGVSYKIQTTATAIPNSQTTYSWTNSANLAISSAVFKPAAPADTITITSPVAYKTFQRSGSTGSISITGTYVGTPTAIEASFNGGAYSTIVASPSGGTFSGTLSGQSQGQGTLTVRWTNDTAVNATAANVGIGDVFVIGGDSISVGQGANAQSYTHATLKAAKFRQDDAWAEGNDGIDTGTSSGSHWPLLATQIMADQSVPVAFISCGTGSTDVAGSNNQWAKNNSGYAEMTAQVTASGVNGVKGVLLHLGPNAVVNASTLSKATYNTAIDTLASNIVADLAGAPKLHLGIFGEVSTGSPPDRTAALNNIRGAIIEAHNDNANVKPGPCLIEQDYSDGVHPASDAELAAVAKRWWVALKESLYSGSGGRGPRVSSAQWDTGRTEITVVFDRVLKTGLTFGTGCWAVSDNGTPMTVSSVDYHGSNTSAVVVTVSAAAVGAANTTTVTFANGDTAVGLVVPMSADITMPSGSAIQIPAEPIYAQAVSEYDVTAPTLTSPSFTGTAQTTGTATVTTNEANGTLYCVVTTGSTSPTGAQVRAGQDSTGAAAAYASSQAITTTGAKNFSATGLTAGTTYYAHFQHRDANTNDSTVSTSAGDATDPIPSITLTLTTNGTTPAASLSSLKWAWFDQVTPDLFSAPTDKGAIETTDGSGVLSISIPNSTKTSGQVGWLIVTDSDGTTTQNPAHKLFAGPVAVN